MEEYNCEMINIFNKNFETTDFKNIIRLYKKEISIVQYPEENNFKQEYKYLHPLFKNYNYCFFCEKKETTKYTQNLNRIHIPLTTNTIGEFLMANKIKLRPINNRQLKLAKRRFIKSYDNHLNNEMNKNIEDSNSDTELYIYNEKNNNAINKDNINNSFNNTKNNIYSININKKKKKNKNSINNLVDKIYSPFNGKNNKNNKINNKPKNRNNLITTNNEDKKSFSVDNAEEIKTNYNMEDSEKNNNSSIINKPSQEMFEIKNNELKRDNKLMSKMKTPTFLNNNNRKVNDNTKEEDMQSSSNINSEFKISISEKDKKEENESKGSLDKMKDEGSPKNYQVFDDFVNQTKKFFGFGKQNNKIRDTRRTLSGHIPKNFKNKKNSINYAENNCSICFQEIKEKFTLICGDFFCTECIRQTVLTAIKEISNLDKLSCPTCKEPIEANTIKKLLTEEEFNKYNYLITKIQGYRNEDYIPCPYPDCPEFAQESQFSTNIVICQNGHTFCKKCLELIDKNIKDIKEKEHTCFENITLEEQKTSEFFKKNKNFRKCPKCKNMVVREGGECNNMTCTNIWCGYEFCWICNGKYEESHYKNPISMCFGLGEIDKDKKLLKYSRIRLFRCILIFLLIIFIILPLVVTFCSIFAAGVFIIAFVLDGSAMKNIQLKSSFAHKFFYKIVYAFFICISIAFIPLGYFGLAGFLVFIPIYCIYNKIKKKDGEEME